MGSPRKRILADRPRFVRRQGSSKLGAVKLKPQSEVPSGMVTKRLLPERASCRAPRAVAMAQ